MENLLSVIVIATVIFCFTACEDPHSTPLEYGNVRISFANDTTGGRTIYPSKVFDRYVYTFTKQGGAPRAMSPSDGVFALETGSWNVRVDAYIGAVAAAAGAADFTLDTDESITVPISLQAEETTGYGIFKYHIQYPADTTAEIFTLTKLPEMTTVDINPVQGETAINGTAGDIPAGIYQMNVRFANNGLYAGTNEIVYIYALLTTEYGTTQSPIVFEEQDFSNLLPIMNAEIVITAPVKTAVPHTAAESAGHFSIGAASWSPFHNPFLGGTEYTVTVTLTANNGYTFTNFSSATINGEGAAISHNTGAAVTLSYTFPATDERTVTGIALKTQPDTLIYTHGDPLDLAGLVVTLTHDDTTTEDVADADFTAKNITTNPAHGNHLVHVTHDGQPVTILYGDLTPITTATLTVNKADPTVNWPTGLTATYGQTLADISLPGDSAGTFTWTTPSASVGNVGTRSHNMTFTPTDTENYNTVTDDVDITVNKANPSVIWPTGLTATYGQTLANISLPGNGTSTPSGMFTWSTPSTSVGVPGTRSFSMTFTPTDTENYNTLMQSVSITVGKADPAVTWPTGLTATYGQTLANISLPGNGTSSPAGTFTWTTPNTSVGALGTRSFSMTFTPTDTTNYNTLTQNVSITVNKANPTVTWPTGLTAAYGQTLANISLPGNGTSSPAGTFTWTTPSTSVGALGTRSFSMTFTPTDTTNYNTLTQNVSITVSKANPTVTWPTGLTATYGQTLANISLSGKGTSTPAGTFTWTTPSTSVGNVGIQSHSMIFTPTDTANYNTLTQNVNITVNKANPTVTWPTGLTATYGQTLANISLSGKGTGTPGGIFTWTTPSTSVGNVGMRSFSMTFAPTTDMANYNTLTQNVSITVNKANPTVTWPTGLTATYGQTLSNISLPGNGTSSPAGTFTWTTPSTSVGNAGTRSHGMTFTPADTANYNTLTQNVNITVRKANPTVTWPTGLTAAYGQTLSNISLPGNGSGSTAGTFTWDSPLSSSVGAVGTKSFELVFFPNDTTNYNTVSEWVNVTVRKANPIVTWPTGLVAYYGQTLSDISLPGNGSGSTAGTFRWDAPLSSSVGAVGTKSFELVFFPNDTTNYNTVSEWVMVRVNARLVEMVYVPGGSFQMGNPDTSIQYTNNERPVHTVTLSAFNIGKYEVTQTQYQTVMGTNPSYFSGSNLPVERVSWYDALVFCNRLSIAEGFSPAYSINGSTNPDSWGVVPTAWNDPNLATWNAVQIVTGSTGYQLPTEAQWEYAAKGGNGSPGNYRYAGSNDVNAVAWYSDNSNNTTHAVGTKAPNGLGIYDMSGNVFELCWDWLGAYTSTPKTNPVGSKDFNYRGGNWGVDAMWVRSTYRDGLSGGGRYSRWSEIGFRVVRP